MKMERIGENQIKIELNKTDLTDRNIKLSELAYGGDKARELFRDIMEIAFEEHGFDVDNTPIMVEAIPVTIDSITILVTKVTDPDELEKRLEKLPSMLNSFDNKLNGMNSSFRDRRKKAKKANIIQDSIIIFSFDNIDTVADVSKRIHHKFDGLTVLYKEDLKYFLVLECKKEESIKNQSEIEAILFEYGNKHMSGAECKYYLKEHGEVIIKKDALMILATHLS